MQAYKQYTTMQRLQKKDNWNYPGDRLQTAITMRCKCVSNKIKKAQFRKDDWNLTKNLK